VALNQWNNKLRRLEGVMQTMGAVVAWAHLRSSGRQGSSCADEWISFGGNAAKWRGELLDYAQSYAKHVVEDWTRFANAFSSGGLKQTAADRPSSEGKKRPIL
jgi:uncharacterized protein (DUF2252 family)